MASRHVEEYSQPWMRGWVEKAAGTLSVEDACRAVGVSEMDYHKGRLNDLAFDQAAQVFDQVLDMKILGSVRTKAIGGDLQAQALYYSKARLPAFIPAFPSWQSSAPARRNKEDPAQAIDPEVAEAMIRAGLEAAAAKAKAATPRRRGEATSRPKGGKKPPAPR
jgi:hypothetical protein